MGQSGLAFPRTDREQFRPHYLSTTPGTMVDVDEPMFFDRDGDPVDLATFGRLYADPDSRFLSRETVGTYEVVTAWLGLDQGLGADPARPLIFGTVALVRGAPDELFEGREWFAATEAAALRHHADLVERLRA